MKDKQKILMPNDEFYNEVMSYLGDDGFFFLIVSGEEAERLKHDEAERNRRFVNGVLKVLAAAAHFAKVSRQAEDIAKVVNTTPEEVHNWAKTPLWEQAVKYYGWHGNLTPQEEPVAEIGPISLRESFLIYKVFQKEEGSRVRFETYDGAIKARTKYIERYHFVLWDSEANWETLDKLDVVLAFPEANMSIVRNGVKRRKSIADLGLRPIKKTRERPKIDVNAPLRSIIECVMRNGLVVVGEYIWNARYYMVLRVGARKGAEGKVVIVYKHALYDFRIVKDRPKPKPPSHRDDWDNEDESRYKSKKRSIVSHSIIAINTPKT